MHIDDPAVSRIVFHPRKEDPFSSPGGIPTRTPCEGAEIGGYLFPRPESRALLLFFHGNGEIAADYGDLARFYTACGVCLWVVDYRGYGTSTGSPAYTRMLDDAEVLFDDIDRIAAETENRFDHRLVMGRSLGSASALLLAANHPSELRGLILDSPFAFGPSLIQRLGGIRPDAEGLPDGRDNIDRMRICTLPTLILHGTEDFIIPISDADALHQASANPYNRLVKIAGAGHNDLLVRGFERYFSEISELVRRCVPQ